MTRQLSVATILCLLASTPAEAQLGMTLAEAQKTFRFSTAEPRTVSYSGHPGLKGKKVLTAYAQIGIGNYRGRAEPASKLFFIDDKLVGLQPSNPDIFIKNCADSLKQRTDGRDVALRFVKRPSPLTRGFPTLTKKWRANLFNPINTRVGDLVTVNSNGTRSTSDYSVTTGVERLQFQYVDCHAWNVLVDRSQSYVAVAEYDSLGQTTTSSLSGSSQSVSTTARKVLVAIPELFWAISIYESLSDTGRHNELLEQYEVPEDKRQLYRANRIGALLAGYIDAMEPSDEECLRLIRHSVDYVRRRGLKFESLSQVICSHLALKLDKCGHQPDGQRRMRVLAEYGGEAAVPLLLDIRRKGSRKSRTLACNLIRSVAQKHNLPAAPQEDTRGVVWNTWAKSIQ